NEDKKLLDFSYSRMGMYRQCPQKYKFRYIDKIPEKPKSYFSFGHAVHGALEFLYNVKSPPFPTAKEMLAVFEKDWQSSSYEDKGYASADKAKKDYLDGVKMLTAYYKKHSSAFSVPLAVEYKNTVAIDGLNVMVVVDRIDYLGGGKISIVDYKTGKTAEREPDQLHMYQKILENSQDLRERVAMSDGFSDAVKIEKLLFYYVPGQSEQIFDRCPDMELNEFWREVLVTADDIRAEKFSPSPDERNCAFCDYKPLCPIFGGKTQTKTSVQKMSSPVIKEETLSEKIDRYGEMAGQALALKAEIINAMKQNGFVKHFGKKYEAELLSGQKYVFKDRQKVMEFLTQTGLIKKAMAPTHSLIEKLISDGEIPQKEREKLLSFASLHDATELKFLKLED
ncbi:MAG: PD-(D/E)XK nuclease family protein, partial [Elusimicrobia bacterium]|nr:PD-(D/E)XK nuclease family protein [Elusimicrobiota bacterium]